MQASGCRQKVRRTLYPSFRRRKQVQPAIFFTKDRLLIGTKFGDKAQVEANHKHSTIPKQRKPEINRAARYRRCHTTVHHRVRVIVIRHRNQRRTETNRKDGSSPDWKQCTSGTGVTPDSRQLKALIDPSGHASNHLFHRAMLLYQSNSRFLRSIAVRAGTVDNE